MLKTFNKLELKRDFYPMFLRLMDAGFDIEAFMLMLSIWNFARFRYAVRTFKVDEFERIVRKLDPLFQKFSELDFRTINFDKHKKDIRRLFQTLAVIRGIEKTGAPKLMHLKAPKVFVMWDRYIREYYGFRQGDANDYVDFLKLMQRKFAGATVKAGRTLPKLIDEHNYITITAPALQKSKVNEVC